MGPVKQATVVGGRSDRGPPPAVTTSIAAPTTTTVAAPATTVAVRYQWSHGALHMLGVLAADITG